MIYVQFNKVDYEYDIHSLIKAFYPNEEVKVSLEPLEQREEMSFSLVIFYETSAMKCTLTPPIDSREKEKEIYLSPIDYENRIDTKNQLKRALYRLLAWYSKTELPWGTLTGIRPTKLTLNMLEEHMSEAEVISFMKETYLTSQEKIDLSLSVAKWELKLLEKLDYQNGYSLYIGIPFCPSTCLYCSFTSYPVSAWRDRMDDYLDGLEKEIEFTARTCKHKVLNTIYIGGGTPTTLSPLQLKRLIQKIKKEFDLSGCVEFTVEAGRPDSITREKLLVLREEEITRISINPQTMKDETLNIIGRHHTVADAIESFQLARELGFEQINMDLIIGLPNESLSDVKETMRQIKLLDPDNLTIHSLALKRAAKLAMFRDEYQDLTFENTQETIKVTADVAKDMGLFPYYLYRQKNMAGNFENVGYAKSDKAGIYNILIMEEKQTILALGAGASSKFVLGKGKKAIRVENPKDVTNYLSRVDEMIERKRNTMEEIGWL